jgi:hypothetical protein
LNYLLPAQTLLDLCAEESNGAQMWSQAIETTSLRVSVISIAQAQAAISQLVDAQLRAHLDADLSALLANIEADAGIPLSFESGHAAVWKALMHDSTLAGLGQTDRQVYATAIYEGLSIVEESRPETPALKALGVELLLLDSLNER